MRIYGLAAVLALAGVGMLTGAAVISRHKPASAAVSSSGRGGDLWGASYFPNVTLTTHDKNIPMPNLQLSEADVTKLLGYIEEESQRIGKLRAREAPPAGHEHHGGHAHHEAAAAGKS